MPPLRRNWDDSSGAEGRQDGLGVVQFSHTLPLYLGVLPHTILRQIMQRPNPSLLQLLQSFRQKKLLLIYFPPSYYSNPFLQLVNLFRPCPHGVLGFWGNFARPRLFLLRAKFRPDVLKLLVSITNLKTSTRLFQRSLGLTLLLRHVRDLATSS